MEVDGNHITSRFIDCNLGILSPQLVTKYCPKNPYQSDIHSTRTKKVSYISLYLYQVDRIPMNYIGFGALRLPKSLFVF